MKWHKLGYAALVVVFLMGSAMVVPALAQGVQDNVTGSFLVFPRFDIRSGNSTHIRITDTSTNGVSTLRSLNVHLNYICPGSSFPGFPPTFCDTLDESVPFTAHQTTDIDVAASFPPCQEGFIVAYAVNIPGTSAVAFDSLIGSAFISFADGTSEASNAIAFQSQKAPLALLGTNNAITGNYDLTFGTASSNDYVALPKVLHGNFRAVTASSSADLILLTLAMVTNDDNPFTRVLINLWSATETPFSTAHQFVCWERTPLWTVGLTPNFGIDSHFANPPLGSAFGSLKITAAPNVPIRPVLGALHETTAPGVAGSTASSNLRNLFHCNPTFGTCPQSATFSTDPLP